MRILLETAARVVSKAIVRARILLDNALRRLR